MFQTEHGPSGFDGPGGGDEVNIVEKGKNYGWPIIHHKQIACRTRVAVARVHAGVRACEWRVLSRLGVSAVQRKFFLWMFARREADSRGARRTTRREPGRCCEELWPDSRRG